MVHVLGEPQIAYRVALFGYLCRKFRTCWRADHRLAYGNPLEQVEKYALSASDITSSGNEYNGTGRDLGWPVASPPPPAQ